MVSRLLCRRVVLRLVDDNPIEFSGLLPDVMVLPFTHATIVALYPTIVNSHFHVN